MFRIESYITSIILSYVDRYIKNFRQQDAQVSLWEGDGSFQNLNLDLEVLEEELNLPFSFVSGHIHELLIHVPWTRLTSEPVQITINTIECVMKLKPAGTHQPHVKHSRRNLQTVDDPQSQSSLMSSLVNKIICNVSVTCNNLILKYVEEDIVLSMNIKTLSFGTVNNNWEPAFMELSASQLELRKLISLSDVTICLDKRNASGRIESYLEPLLYRCFITIRLCQSYSSVSAKRAASTRLDVLCERMAFTVSEPQLPMLLRLMSLCLALHRKQFSQTSLHSMPVDDATGDKEDMDEVDESGNPEESWSSWSTWAFGWMPNLIPLVDEGDENDQDTFPPINIFNFGFYVDTFTLALKLCESDTSGGMKTQSQAFMHLLLKGCRMDLLSHNTDWTNIQMGICQATVKPDGDCCCGVSEVSQLVYLSSGSMQEGFLSGSLFDKQPVRLQDRLGHSWKYHLESVSEAIMLEKSPAFAVDYLSCIQDKFEETEEESDDEDTERLPVKEKVVIRYVAGPVVIRVCSGLIHRLQMLMKACDNYDYVPYTTNTVLPAGQDNQVLDLVHRLSEKSVEMDEDLYSRYLPVHTAQFTAFNTIVELYPANHLPVHYSTLGRKLSRSQRRTLGGGLSPSPPPCVTLECQCAYATLTRPLYPDKILLMASKFHKDRLPPEITNTSLTRLAFKAVGVSSSLRLPFLQAMKVLEMSSVSSEQSWHSLITPLDDCVSSDIGVHIENVTTTASKAKLMLLCEIVSSLIATNNRQRYLAVHKTIYNTTLLHDAATTTDTIYLKLVVEHVKLRRVVAALYSSSCLSVMACQLFAVRLPEKGDEWETMIVAAPDTDTPVSAPLLEALYQQPISLNQFPPVLTFTLREVRFSADPLLYSWLHYTPSASFPAHQSTLLSHKSTDSMKSRKVSESSLSSYVRRAPTPQESAPSSSERETHPSSQPLVDTIPSVALPDRVATLYPQWKTMIVFGDVSQMSIYLPNCSLASPSPLTMEEGLQTALRQTSPLLQVLVIKLPSVSLRCANHKQGLQQFTDHLPIRLPQNVWNVEKDNFPWTVVISDLHCYTLHGLTSLPLLKPVSFNCTIGTSPKFMDRNTMISLALCVHLDTTPVNIKISEEQVVLIVSLIMAQMKVLNVLMPSWSAETTSAETSSLKIISSDESSNISQSDDLARIGGPVKVKLTGWLQWTLVRTTLSMYSKPSRDSSDELKLSLDVEDIILSLDVERVYHKVKFKVATASVCHHTRPSTKEQWRRGVFHGLVMRGYDPDGITVKHSTDESQAPAGFLMATVTRAKCNNFHSRLGSPTKYPALGKKSLKSEKFITEIEIKMQPLDFVLSPTTLGIFVQVLDPLLCLLQAPPSAGSQKHSPQLHASSLPLLYLDLMTIRVVLPTSRHQLAPSQPDVLIVQFDGMTANPHPENPLCRTPLRPDIYHKGEKQRILNIPGSELEDRQYQFNLSCLRVQTGMWCDLEEIFAREVAVSSQQQNPALDWNEGRSPMFQVPAHQLMSPLVHSFNLSIVVAPAMLYMDKDIVCGHAAEINAVSDIVATVTLDQLTLCGVLTSEMVSVFRLASRRQPRGTVASVAPTTSLALGSGPHLTLAEHDSGIDSTESTSSHIRQADPNLPAVHAVSPSGFSQISGFVHSLPSSIYPTPLVWASKKSVVPCEVLITGSAVVLSVFAVEHQEQHLSYEPLFYTHISQPHTFICRNTDNIFTCQMSAFDLGVRSGVAGHTVSSLAVNGTKPFPQPLVETRNGEPHPLTGIPPSVITVKVAWDNDKPPKIDFDMGRPLRIICTLEIIEYLKRLRALVFLSFFEPLNRCPDTSVGVTIQVSEVSASDDSDHYLRKLLRRYSKFTVNTQQVVLVVKSSTQEVDGCAELCLSVGECQGQVTSTLSLQHAVSGILRLGTVTISTRKITSPRVRLLLNPWQLTIYANLSWDSWLSSADPPLVSISADSDILSIQLSPEQLICLQALWRDYCPLLSSNGGTNEKPVLSRANSNGDSSGEEQHYHDDLQAGAFQFVDVVNERPRDEPPLTYQVVFWSSLPPAMAWRYPQPRAITKFSIMPIPFRDMEEGMTTEPTCTLQYYSDTQACYLDHVTFTLSQTSAQVVELPQYPPRVVATTWRVVLNCGGAAVPVKALAASIRVDSYFSPSLIPAVQIAVSLTAIQLSLWTHTDSFQILPEPLDRYYLDRRFPEEHDFFTAVLEQANIAYSVWPKISQQVTLKGRMRVDVLNYHTLSSQCCLPPCPLVASGYTTADCRQYSLVTGHCHMRMGPALSHSLTASLASWLPSQESQRQVVLTPYVVCNNTCMPLRFRQAGSDEYIPLQVFQCHLYSWRTTKHLMKLEFGLLEPEDNEWSKSLTLRAGSSSVIRMSTSSQDYAFIVSVKRLTPTVCQVVVNGQLSLYNNLSVPVEVRMIPEGDGQQQTSLVVVTKTSPPSVVLDPRHNLSLKVRFSSLPAPWSGDIPLRPTAKQSKQWEVKLPLKERGQFRSVWCHVIFDLVEDIYQMLVVFSPLYTIKSLLPCPANVLVETPALASSQVVPISGQGTVQHLDTPGLSDEKHNITFQLDGKVPASSPPVSLHYHMLDGTSAPTPPETDIPSLLGHLQCPAPPPAWPYLGENWAGVEWISTTQPDTLTQVRVKFSEDTIASNTLLVEVQPWALLINSLGSHVYLQGKERTLCSLAHRAVISPPPLESTFQIGVELENSVQLSDPIQLKRGPGFEMPHIPGLLPPSGFINTTVTGKYSVCFMNVTSAEVSNLRLIHIRSSYVIASLSKRDLNVSAIAVKASDCQYTLPEEMLKQYITVRSQPKSSKLKCQPLTEWRVLGATDGEEELVPYLVIAAGDKGPVSCPARLPGGSERYSVPVLFPATAEDSLEEMLVMTVEQVEGQTHVLLWDQPHPQVTIHNHTNNAVIFAKAKTDNGGGFVADCEHIKWQLRIPAGEKAHYTFPNVNGSPETALPHALPPAVIAVLSNQTNEVKWSDPVVLTQCTGRLLSLLGLPDMTLTVTRRGYTTHITLSQASHTEILAVDIRGQLTRQLLSERRLSNISHSSGEERQNLNTDHESSAPPSFPPSESGTGEGRGLEVTCYVHGLTATLLSQSELGCECHEVAALTVDHVGVTVHPHPHQDLSVREMKVHTTVGDIQLDNQEFSLGGYDFPVVLLMQKPRDPRTADVVMSQHARSLVDKARARGSAADLTVVMDVNSHATIAIQDVSIKLAPLQIYIEDKYIFHLKECFMNTLPSSLTVETSPNPSIHNTSHATTQKNDAEVKSKSKDHSVFRVEENEPADDSTEGNVKKELSEGAEEEDLFNVSEPEDNQSPEEPATVEVVASNVKTSTYETDSVWTVQASSSSRKEVKEQPPESVGFPIPPEVLSASRDLARPLRLRSLSISELDLLVSIHTSTKFYIALDHSPLQLAAFRRSSLFTTAYRLGHSLTLHYFFGAIYGTGWALGSLELLGAPGGLARSLGLGLRDFISLPLQGMLLGPRAFFIGIAHGSASLMHHFAAGTITSVTRLAASWARTLDRLTLDTRDLERSEQLRRLRPQSLTQGVVQGLTEFGISLIGAISSIAHHPLQYVMSERPDHGLVSSVGLGLVGVITRPLSGVAELVALTGEGLLSGVGWTNVPRVRHEPVTQHNQCGTDARLKYQWKLLFPSEHLLIIAEATSDCYEAVTLLVTTSSLYVVNSELDIITRAVRLPELQVVTSDDDPTLVAFRVQPAKEQAQLLSQSRIIEYVRESQRMLIGELSHSSPSTTPVPEPDEPLFQFFVNPQVRNYMLAVLHFAISHSVNRGFSVIS